MESFHDPDVLAVLASGGTIPDAEADARRKRHVHLMLDALKSCYFSSYLDASKLMCSSVMEIDVDGADFMLAPLIPRQVEKHIWIAVKAPGEAAQHKEDHPDVHVITVDLTQKPSIIDASILDQIADIFARPYGIC